MVHVGIASLWWQGKRSQHSRRVGNPKFYVSGKRPMVWCAKLQGMNYYAVTEQYINSNSYFAKWWSSATRSIKYRLGICDLPWYICDLLHCLCQSHVLRKHIYEIWWECNFLWYVCMLMTMHVCKYMRVCAYIVMPMLLYVLRICDMCV